MTVLSFVGTLLGHLLAAAAIVFVAWLILGAAADQIRTALQRRHDVRLVRSLPVPYLPVIEPDPEWRGALRERLVAEVKAAPRDEISAEFDAIWNASEAGRGDGR